jgi:hypothetical protein
MQKKQNFLSCFFYFLSLSAVAVGVKKLPKENLKPKQ